MSQTRSGRSQATAIIPHSRCPGPKLRAFKHQDAEIEWGRRLDGDRAGVAETDGYVFEVKIRSRLYALKVFKFFHPHSTMYYWGVYLGTPIPLKKVIYYTDPFFAECRAYGRIEEASEKLGRKDQLAVKCHGYIYLGDEDKKKLQEKGLDLGMNVLDEKLRQALEGGGRVRAIVKDLAPSRTSVNSRNVRAALETVRKLNELQIYNRDIRAENFVGGKLVDFGSSWTEPHIILDALEPDEAEDSRLEDLVMFDDMIEEEGIKTRPQVQALRNVEYRKKLRGRQVPKG
ncbi:hypothetical protein KVR01_009132 [Diaporthe batatas]|uniref:uncharacterized protein n=1 Tax=Diaporthe batatas TaxID=748121 RepID=UPI001D059F09|nr:uncharacterized protein KVR01_009132 [Diaporthe batatas]KAG8160868.1 hypothetical protein KVR01_009132 [Diaporthe batatas]